MSIPPSCFLTTAAASAATTATETAATTAAETAATTAEAGASSRTVESGRTALSKVAKPTAARSDRRTITSGEAATHGCTLAFAIKLTGAPVEVLNAGRSIERARRRLVPNALVYGVPSGCIPIDCVPIHISAVELVSIYKSIAARDICVSVEGHVSTVPVRSPVTPAPAPSSSCGADQRSNTKGEG